MAQYRKRPVVIEAVRFLPSGGNGRTIARASNVLYNEETGLLEIKTLEGTMLAYPGDWIITGIKGERYPCKADIFNATYEAISPAERMGLNAE